MLEKNKKPFHKGTWQYQEAKAKLSQVMDQVQEKGMQLIVRNRTEVYVILTKKKYDEYTQPKLSLIDFFLHAPCSEIDLDVDRSEDSIRDFDV